MAISPRFQKSIQFLLIIAGVCFSVFAGADIVKLTTSQGKLEGATSPDNSKINVFKSIPFAKPPVGERRWTHSEEAGAWKGTLLATQFSPSCMQHPYPEGTFFSRANPPASEDCLYLNVWTGAKAGDKLPVMVWIHGGGLTRGTGATQAYDGTALAEKGVVLVSINYRLDIFGYFSHPELTDPATGKPLGNFGTSDQVTALKWVRKYIEDFGGDPDNITIFGESAGSFSVHHLMATQHAKGLFHRAIGQSGSSLGSMIDAREKKNAASELAVKYQKKLKAGSLQALKQMDASDILAGASGFRFRPVVDGEIFEDQIYNLFEKGKYNSVPLMVGFNADEGTTLGAGSRVPKDKVTYQKSVEKRYGDLSADFLKIYPADNLYRSTLDAFRDSFATWGMQSWAMMMENTNEEAYLYYFSFQPLTEKLGAYHAAEIVYAFNNVHLVRDEVAGTHRELADTMSDYWVSFASNGKPNPKGLATWLPYTEKNRNYIEFNNKVEVKKNLLPGVWEFHEKVRKSTL